MFNAVSPFLSLSFLRRTYVVYALTQEFLGQGSFGHVTMVRKKEGVMGGALFALKSLSKEAVVEGGQVHHLKDEKNVREQSIALDIVFIVLTYRNISECRTSIGRTVSKAFCVLPFNSWQHRVVYAEKNVAEHFSVRYGIVSVDVIETSNMDAAKYIICNNVSIRYHRFRCIEKLDVSNIKLRYLIHCIEGVVPFVLWFPRALKPRC